MEKSERTFLIVGASGGIGSACAEALGRAGFALALHYGKSGEKAEALAARLSGEGIRSRLVSFDVTNAAECRAKLEADMAEHGAYWGIVHSAGITRDEAFPLMTEEDWFSVISTDLNSFYNVIQPCVMPMIHLRSGGRIIAISSVSGIAGNRGQANYSAAKAGLIGACRALAVELAKRRITVNAVAPGLIDTEMAKIPEEARSEILKSIPMKRLGRADEVASLVAFLASPGAEYITRQAISINGGMI